MTLASTQSLLEEAEALLASIRGFVLVRLHDGIRPADLIVPVECARAVNKCAAEIGDGDLTTATDALEAWLALLANETDQISPSRISSLLDQISEVDMAFVAHRSRSEIAPLDVSCFVDESFDSLHVKTNDAAENTDALELELDSELAEVFREEAESLLTDLRDSLGKLSTNSMDRDALWEIKRSAHTLKGAAGVVGMRRASALAHRVEDLLERLSAADGPVTRATIDLLREAAGCLEYLTTGEGSQHIDERLQSLNALFAKVLEPLSEPKAEERLTTGTKIRETQNVVSLPEERSARVVRVSLSRLDDLVIDLRGLAERRASVLQGIEELKRQILESGSNVLRLQAASSKIEGLGPTAVEGVENTPVLSRTVYELSETARDARVIQAELAAIRDRLDNLLREQDEQIAELYDRLVRLRKVEFQTVATRLERTVRVTCEDEGKFAELIIENGSQEVDTQIIDSLIEPLMHLLKNAVVHGIETPETRRLLGKPETGTITVNLGSKGSDLVLTLRDDGSGIDLQALIDKAIGAGLIDPKGAASMDPEQKRELIFLPGLTTAETLSLNAGRGVGMSIIRESIAAIKGWISVESYPQLGTKFTIRIPIPFAENETKKVSVQKTQIAEDIGPNTVLLIDDSPSVRLTVAKSLQNAGWSVVTANNGHEALLKLHASDARPAAVISDLEMPVMGGYEFIAALQSEESLKNLPVVFMSSRNGEAEHRNAIAAGAAGYLVKPCTGRELVKAVKQIAAKGHVNGGPS